MACARAVARSAAALVVSFSTSLLALVSASDRAFGICLSSSTPKDRAIFRRSFAMFFSMSRNDGMTCKYAVPALYATGHPFQQQEEVAVTSSWFAGDRTCRRRRAAPARGLEPERVLAGLEHGLALGLDHGLAARRRAEADPLGSAVRLLNQHPRHDLPVMLHAPLIAHPVDGRTRAGLRLDLRRLPAVRRYRRLHQFAQSVDDVGHLLDLG